MRPVLKAIDQHLYVLSTLALALMVQQFAAISGAPSRSRSRASSICRAATSISSSGCRCSPAWWSIVGLELLYRYTLVGHAFLAIAEDNYAARALGLPDSNLRIASFALAGAIGALAGFAGGQLLLAFFANAPMLTFYGFVPVALGGMGNNPRRRRCGADPRACSSRPPTSSSAASSRPLRCSPCSSSCCCCGLRGLPAPRSGGAYDGDIRRAIARRAASPCSSSRAFAAALPFLVLLVIGLALPWLAGGYWGVIAIRACIYWVLVAGLNLMVGFAGQLAIGWVAMLTLGAYTASRACGRQRDARLAPLSGARWSQAWSARFSG